MSFAGLRRTGKNLSSFHLSVCYSSWLSFCVPLFSKMPVVSLPQVFGFIGLGAMGYPMATQLRRKLPKSTPLVVYDINRIPVDKFVAENSAFGLIHVATNSREVCDAAVSCNCKSIILSLTHLSISS